jgi:uncharacterized membrane protein YbhN (UPF0104 family)
MRIGGHEITLMPIIVGFGAQPPTAVLATLAFRLMNYWLPLSASGVTVGDAQRVAAQCPDQNKA